MQLARSKKTLMCPKCAEEISLEDCFKDKATEMEFQKKTVWPSNVPTKTDLGMQFYNYDELI